MKATRLRGMPVVSIADAQKVGEVKDLVVNPNARHVVAVRIKSTPEGSPRIVPVESVHKVGRDALTIKDSGSVREETPTDVEGTATLAEFLGTKVVTHDGDFLGTVAEVDIDPSNFEITGYELSTGILSGLIAGRKELPVDENIHFGKDILMVPDEMQGNSGGEMGSREPELKSRRPARRQ